MKTKTKGFYAYPDYGILIGPTIESGISDFNDRAGDTDVTGWKEMDIAGRFIANEVLASIATSDFLVADISKLNFNVTFEVGYAIGRGKPVMLTRMAAISNTGIGGVDEVGIFDTIGYQTYNNREDTIATEHLFGALKRAVADASLDMNSVEKL